MSTSVQLRSREMARITSEWQLEYWASKFGVSVEQIIEAIDEVGDQIVDVRQYFFCGPPRPEKYPYLVPERKIAEEEMVRHPIQDWLCARWFHQSGSLG